MSENVKTEGDPKVIRINEDELLKAISDAAEKASKKTKTELEEKLEREKAKNQLPQQIKEMTSGIKFKEPVYSDRKMGLLWVGQARAKRNENETFEDVMKAWGLEMSNYFNPENIKGIVIGNESDGGALVHEMYDSEIIPVLNNAVIMRKAGTPVIPMPNGNFTMTAGATSTTAYWIGEATAKTTSKPTFKKIKMDTKKLAVKTVVSDESIRFATPDLARYVQDDMVNKLAIKEDAAYIKGTGTVYQPKGVYYQVADAQRFDATGSSTAATRRSDLLKARAKLSTNNIQIIKPIWAFSANTESDLLSQLTSDSYLTDYARAMSENQRLFGAPYYVTNAIADDEVYYIDISYAIIGESIPLSVRFFEFGSYQNSSGVTISGQDTDEHVFQATRGVDFAAKYDKFASVIESHDWNII